MAALCTFLFIVLLSAAFAANCPSTIPNAPVFPAANAFTSVSAPAGLITKHWSEVSKLSNYRPSPPAGGIIATPAQTECPHKGSGLKDWHDASTWGGNVPGNGANINIPANTQVLVSKCSVDPSYVFGIVNIPKGSSLIFDDAPISFAAKGITVAGSLLLGSETCRLRNKITITLHGSRKAQALPGPNNLKGIEVTGTIDIHGVQYFPTWTRLAATATAGSKHIFIQDVVNWQAGQRLVVTTTELKDSRDWHRNEERTIVSVKRVQSDSSISAIELDTALDYNHYGGKEYQAEVSLLSRNIVIQGDEANSPPTDTDKAICTDPGGVSTYPCNDKYLTGFGAHIFIYNTEASGRFSGVEMFRVGQTNVLGHYPIHFHMMGDLTASDYTRAYVRDSSVHDSYFRCYAIHGTRGVKLTENTAYNAIGHCYFLEDGVEEDNIISYNQAAHVHPLGPFQNPSIDVPGDSWYGQTMNWYKESSTLILPSDMSAGCFYITNTYNDIIGNAASGGWAGFAIPSLKRPVKLHKDIDNLNPSSRPFRKPFAGNSAHSSGFWWVSAGGIYVGGELKHDTDGLLIYNSGRSASRSTCKDQTLGTVSKPNTGCYDAPDWMWLQFTDNKVFLSNRGMQNWGDRSEIVRLELHDVSLAMNVFGKVWIDNLLMECRTEASPMTLMSGCPDAPATEGNKGWNKCNKRDYAFFNHFGGFQWYDVHQQHIMTNSVFRNCNSNWRRCAQGSNACENVAVFTSLTHSDEFVPQLMQVSSGMKYQSVGNLWRFSTKLSSPEGVTVSGRLQSWYDADGSASQLGVRAMIGSAWANKWWKYNDQCDLHLENYRCPLSPGDSAASVVFTQAGQNELIPGTYCPNGGRSIECPVIAKITHFGVSNEDEGLSLAWNGKATGPLIASSGGWFVRYNKGTPKTLILTRVQVKMEDTLLLAIPYPANTDFNIYHKAADWCSTSWAKCRHDYRQVTSVAAVKSAFGDAYYWDNNAKILYIRLVQPANFFPKDDPAVWSSVQPAEQFSRGGLTLITDNYQTSIVIEANCNTNPCAPQNDVRVPAGNPVTVTPTTKPVTTPAPTPTTKPVTTPAPTPTTKPVTPTTKPGTSTTKPTTKPSSTTSNPSVPSPSTTASGGNSTGNASEEEASTTSTPYSPSVDGGEDSIKGDGMQLSPSLALFASVSVILAVILA